MKSARSAWSFFILVLLCVCCVGFHFLCSACCATEKWTDIVIWFDAVSSVPVFWVGVDFWVVSSTATISCETGAGEGEEKKHEAPPITRAAASTYASRHRFFVVIGRVGVFFVLNQKSGHLLPTLSFLILTYISIKSKGYP